MRAPQLNFPSFPLGKLLKRNAITAIIELHCIAVHLWACNVRGGVGLDWWSTVYELSLESKSRDHR